MGCAPFVVAIPLCQCNECMKKDTTPKDIVSLIAWIVLTIVSVIVFGHMEVGVIVNLCDVMRELLADLGLQGWALAAIPLLCCFVAGWLAWRYLHGSRRVFALLLCAGLIGDIALRIVAPDLEGRVREFGQPFAAQTTSARIGPAAHFERRANQDLQYKKVFAAAVAEAQDSV